MKISLRKANAVQTSVQEHIKSFASTVSISINEFQNPENELIAARQTLADNHARRVALNTVLYRIRAQVGRANLESGVSDLLCEAAAVDKEIGYLKALADSKPTESLDVVKGKIRKIAEAEKSARMYGYSDTVDTGVLLPEQIEAYKAQIGTLKKRKQSINDKVLELNVRTEIELDQDTINVLTKESLV